MTVLHLRISGIGIKISRMDLEKQPAGERPTDRPAEAPCVRCWLPTAKFMGDIPICDQCYRIRGSCCPEFGEDDLS